MQRRLNSWILAAAVAGTIAWGWRQAAAQGKTDLRAEILVFRLVDEQSPPEPTDAFVVGETAIYASRAAGFGVRDGRPGLQAQYHLVTPDGTRVEVPVEAGATELEEPGAPVVLIGPLLQILFQPGMHPTGRYELELSLTDTVTGATTTARKTLFLFLTPGSRELASPPEPREAVALDDPLFSPGFWNLDADELAATLWPIGLRWTSVEQSAMRSMLGKATFAGRPLPDVRIRLEDGSAGEVQLFAYNRGDTGVMSREAFQGLFEELKAELTRRAGTVPQDLTPRSGIRPGHQVQILGWRIGPVFARLESAESVVRQEDGRGRAVQPEYVSLTFQPDRVMTRAEMAGRQATDVTAHALASRVVRDPNGDVYLAIPMHDQGEKDYCAAAAAERILDYYGTSISQHEIAQRIQMDTGGGASYEAIVRGLRSLAQSVRLQLRILMQHDDRTLSRMVDEYNRMARRERKPAVDFSQPLDSAYGPRSVWELFDNEVFLRSRIRTPVPVNRFFDWCRQKIDAGVPLYQVCVIGILPEEAELGQDPGLHARLIVGYNARTREILYSDSWGLGHERKRMPLDHAFAITTGLLTLEPR